MFCRLYSLADRARDSARRKKWAPAQASGRRGEDLAHRYLRKLGFVIVARNYRPPSGLGEIDLIARDGDAVVFVEVKSRASDEYGSPERAIGAEKEMRLLRTARDYIRRANLPWEMARFDVVSVTLAETPDVSHYRDVFRTSRV